MDEVKHPEYNGEELPWCICGSPSSETEHMSCMQKLLHPTPCISFLNNNNNKEQGAGDVSET